MGLDLAQYFLPCLPRTLLVIPLTCPNSHPSYLFCLPPALPCSDIESFACAALAD